MKNIKLSIIILSSIGFCTQSYANWLNDFLNAFTPILVQPPRPQQQQQSQAELLNQQQAEQYIGNIAQILQRALKVSTPFNELSALLREVKNIIHLDSIREYHHHRTYYKKDLIDQFINSAILEQVEKTSYQIAYAKINNTTIARKVAESMRNNAMAEISKKGSIDAYALRPFFGEPLENAVIQATYNYDVPQQQNYGYQQETFNYQPQQPSAPLAEENWRETPGEGSHGPSAPIIQEDDPKLYPSETCAVCFEDFSHKVVRVFLFPCGHDMCKTCAFQWFFDNQNDSCPHCRAKVDKHKLNNELAR